MEIKKVLHSKELRSLLVSFAVGARRSSAGYKCRWFVVNSCCGVLFFFVDLKGRGLVLSKIKNGAQTELEVPVPGC